jgi:hypothetical protein
MRAGKGSNAHHLRLRQVAPIYDRRRRAFSQREVDLLVEQPFASTAALNEPSLSAL